MNSVFCVKMLQWQQVIQEGHPLVGKGFTLGFVALGY